MLYRLRCWGASIERGGTVWERLAGQLVICCYLSLPISFPIWLTWKVSTMLYESLELNPGMRIRFSDPDTDTDPGV